MTYRTLLSNATSFRKHDDSKHSVQVKSISSQIEYKAYLGIRHLVFEKAIKPHEHTDILSFSTDRTVTVHRLLVIRGPELKYIQDPNKMCHDLVNTLQI